MQEHFNAAPETVRSTAGRQIVFVHVGKCAGESAIIYLRNNLDDRFHLFEMHVYDANVRIKSLVEDGPEDLIFLVAKRDPLERFVSAFNWDKYNLFLKGVLDGAEAASWFERFLTADDLGAALTSADSVSRDAARRFSRFGHMGMGQAWYTPLQIAAQIPPDRLHVVDMASLQADLNRFIQTCLGREPAHTGHLPHTKSSYQFSVADPQAVFSKTLSAAAESNLLSRLEEDYQVYRFLSAPRSADLELAEGS